jgi:glycine cleavage system H protein
MSRETISYRRERFGTRLPKDYLYTPSHYWLRQAGDGLWQIGFTRFAGRMLGDIVEFEFNTAPNARIERGQVIGWAEGFKAVSDIYSAASGEFLGPNPELSRAITKLDDDPYGEGWLYSVRGVPDPAATDVHGYIAVLDLTIDTMLESRHDAPKNTGENPNG